MSPDPAFVRSIKEVGEVWGRPGSDLVIPPFPVRVGAARRHDVFGGRVDGRTSWRGAGRVLSGMPKTDDAVRADPRYQSHVRNFIPVRCVRRHDVAHRQGAGWQVRRSPRCWGAMKHSQSVFAGPTGRAGGNSEADVGPGRTTLFNRERPLPSLWR